MDQTPIRNPWQPALPTPVDPASVENARLTKVLQDVKFASRKLEFAKLLFEQPHANPIQLLQLLFPDPNDIARLCDLALIWPTDGEVLRYMDQLARPGNTPQDALPDKAGLAMRYIQLADTPRISAADKLKALAQYQTLMGMDPPKTPAAGVVVNNLIDQRRVFVLPKNLSPEEWEAKNDPSAVKEIELTANAIAAE